MAKSKPAPHLINNHGTKRCSVCKMPFRPDAQPSISEAFANHLLKDHRPRQTTKEVNQAAARIVREATDSQK